MTVDVRFRVDGAESVPHDPASFFEHDLPSALDAAGQTTADALEWLNLVPLTVMVKDSSEAWTLSANGSVTVERGAASEGAMLCMTGEQIADLATDQASFMGFFTWGTLDQRAGRLEHLLDWWLVLRGALDGREIYTPGSIGFTATDGSALDLHQSFRPDDDPARLRAFLEEAGFLHIEGVFGEDEMHELDREIDRHASAYAPDDGRSWWASTTDGTDRLVRLQMFEQHSEAASALLQDDRFLRIGTITGDGHESRASCSALVKPIGIVSGISDVPWHKDCSLGRHSYDCCSMTVGISVTGADATSGQLRVLAGSHRGLVWPAFSRKGTGLPEIDLPTKTGDVTVHLSCTTHMSQPPVERERRVIYSGFSLPPADPDAVASARKRLYRIMQSIPEGVSQKPSSVATE
jgi:Phytanoyl-CoA dioxygenase (PhyH)